MSNQPYRRQAMEAAIEISLVTGRLMLVNFNRQLPDAGILGSGEIVAYNKEECIPHNTMCGVFSTDPYISRECFNLSLFETSI